MTQFRCCGARSVRRSRCGCREVDWLGQQRLGSILQRLPFSIRIAMGADHDDWHIQSHSLGLGKKFKAGHPGMLMSDRIRINETPSASPMLQCRWSRLRKLHHKSASPKV